MSGSLLPRPIGASGYRHTFCAGSETVVDDEFTGALPGRLVRGPR